MCRRQRVVVGFVSSVRFWQQCRFKILSLLRRHIRPVFSLLSLRRPWERVAQLHPVTTGSRVAGHGGARSAQAHPVGLRLAWRVAARGAGAFVRPSGADSRSRAATGRAGRGSPQILTLVRATRWPDRVRAELASLFEGFGCSRSVPIWSHRCGHVNVPRVTAVI